MLAQQCSNNRSHHSGSCHYLLGKLSSCSSAVVSGNKLMCCRDYTESDRNNFSQDALYITVTHMHTRAHWACYVRIWRSQNELNAIVMCYHLHQLFILLTEDSARFNFHHHHPCFGPDEEVARPKEDFLFYTSTSVNFIGWSIVSDPSNGTIIHHHYCAAHVGPMSRWCNDLTRPRSPQHQQICSPDSPHVCQFLSRIQKRLTVKFCQVLFLTFILYSQFQVQRWKTTCLSVQTL